MWCSYAVWATARHGEWAGSKFLLRHQRMLPSALAAATPSTFSSDVQHGLLQTESFFLGVWGRLGMDLQVEYLEHGMFAKPFPLASVTDHPII